MIRQTLTALFLLFIVANAYAEKSAEEKKAALNTHLRMKYDAIHYSGVKPKFDIFKRGMLGYYKLKAEGKVKRDVLTLIDFRISSTKKRMWIIDLSTNEILHHTIVAHGVNSGWDVPKTFGNRRGSNMSSLGIYLTGEEYIGKYGLSLRLDGMEAGFNDNARRRAVVMHPAKYVNNYIAESLGRMGRSFGCPAIPYKNSDKVVKMISNKSVFFIFSPQPDYLAKTDFDDELTAYNYLENQNILI